MEELDALLVELTSEKYQDDSSSLGALNELSSMNPSSSAMSLNSGNADKKEQAAVNGLDQNLEAVSVADELDDVLKSLAGDLNDLDVLAGGTRTNPEPKPAQKTVELVKRPRAPPSEQKTELPKCVECSMEIQGKYINIKNSLFYHPHHFKCQSIVDGEKCNRLLTATTFYEKDGVLYCFKCSNEQFSNKCAYCQQIIKDASIQTQIQALGKFFHPEHFFCAQCGKTFQGDLKYVEYDGQAYCEEDYFALFTKSCSACAKPITSEFIKAFDKHFHIKCLKCADCGMEFDITDEVFESEGRALCQQHYYERLQSICATCHKPIIGKCISTLDKKYHEHHFLCSFCKTELSKSNFKAHSNLPYCSACYLKLFG